MQELFDFIMHADKALFELVAQYGTLCYLILALMIFSETGLIIAPFLPGDGLLFSAGLVASSGALSVWVLVPLLLVAAVLGNIVNYFIGKMAGHRLVRVRNRLFQKYLASAREFYTRHGQKAIVFARFFPIFRTYVPFVGGITEMTWSRFFGSTLLGAAIWVPLFTLAGYFLGAIPWVRDNYGLIFLGLIIVTLIPFGLTILREIRKSMKDKREKRNQGAGVAD